MNKEVEGPSNEQLDFFKFFLELGTIDLKPTDWDYLLCLKSKKAFDLINKWASEPVYTYRHEDNGLVLVISNKWKENELVSRIVNLASSLKCEWIQNYYYGYF